MDASKRTLWRSSGLALGLALMAFHLAVFIPRSWQAGSVWETTRHLVGTGGLLVAAWGASAAGAARPGALRWGLGVVAGLLVIEVLVVLGEAGPLTWISWIFLAWALGLALMAAAVHRDDAIGMQRGLVGGLALVGLAFAMFLVRHLAHGLDAAVAVALAAGILGTLVALVSVPLWLEEVRWSHASLHVPK